MIEILKIVADSWPIATMFIAVIFACIVIYFIRWLKKSEQEDKAYRASQAVTVRNAN